MSKYVAANRAESCRLHSAHWRTDPAPGMAGRVPPFRHRHNQVYGRRTPDCAIPLLIPGNSRSQRLSLFVNQSGRYAHGVESSGCQPPVLGYDFRRIAVDERGWAQRGDEQPWCRELPNPEGNVTVVRETDIFLEVSLRRLASACRCRRRVADGPRSEGRIMMTDRPSHNLDGLEIDLARRIDGVCRRFEADWRRGATAHRGLCGRGA